MLIYVSGFSYYYTVIKSQEPTPGVVCISTLWHVHVTKMKLDALLIHIRKILLLHGKLNNDINYFTSL